MNEPGFVGVHAVESNAARTRSAKGVVRVCVVSTCAPHRSRAHVHHNSVLLSASCRSNITLPRHPPLRCSYPCCTDLSSPEEEPYSEFGTECIRKHPHAEPVHHVSTMSNTHSHRRTSPPSSTERAHVREAKARRNQNLQMHSIARPTQPRAGAPRHACTQEAERQLA